MTEILNGHCERNPNCLEEPTDVFLTVNGHEKEENPSAVKTPRKKVSFHNNVTDIDGDSELLLQNGDVRGELGKNEQDDDAPSLEGILNVSEKINFFKTAFAAESQTKGKNGIKPLGHQSSIPEARLAFVTGMVESSLTGNNSRADGGRIRVNSDVTANVDQEEDAADIGQGKEVDHVLQVTDTPDAPCSSDSETAPNMAATQVTFMKIFAPQKKTVIETVVDTSSILEHREEIRELWEKRMMADDNQSSPSSIVAEKPSPKPQSEEGSEEAVVKTNSESETKVDHKMANGFAKPVISNGIEDGNANHITEEKAEVSETAAPTNDQKMDIDHDNNNCIDSLEEDNTDDYVEEKTYTSELETSIIMKKAEDVPKKEEAHTTTVDESVSEVKEKKEDVVAEPVSTAATPDTHSNEEVDSSTKVEEPIASAVSSVEEQVSSTEKVATENEAVPETSEKMEVREETVTSTSTTEVVHHIEEVTETTSSENLTKTMEVEKSVEGDDDGFVRVEECLPKVEGTETEQDSFVMVEEQKNGDVPKDSVAPVTAPDEHKTATTNGHEENSEAAPPTSTPEPSTDDKPNNPEIEQFVKSGGVKRILPGVQKTEQPYSTCTTETKIAMEIREMREREEELRLMREQSLLSPVVSPVPPKSPLPRSPSPSMKEGSSPTPTGCGYRVSSVFGHKGSTSPSPPVVPDEDKKFKGFSKESSVEKEIRLARDREEELRKQKGLPPREDDSYVKPSQVKSSQVRVFGKMAGANSSSVKQAATAKIQMEIEEQTQREMALRESGSIQTISQERTDAKVAKLKTECITPPATNGNPPTVANGNGNHTNGRASPDVIPYKRVSPSPTNNRPATIFSQPNGKANISMHKFIASKGKETTFSVPRNGAPKEESANRAAVPPPLVKLKRNVSVESKIQQEIMEMKQREEELKLLHMNRSNNDSPVDDENNENEMNQKNNLLEYENGNGNGIHEEDLSPRHNKLIAQWEQRIQKAES